MTYHNNFCLMKQLFKHENIQKTPKTMIKINKGTLIKYFYLLFFGRRWNK